MIHDGLLDGIDQGLKSIRAVEENWSLPKLPDFVALDIASLSGMDTLGIQNFLGGLDEDVQSATKPKYDAGQRARQVWSGVANFPLPTDVDPSAVSTFKQRAIRLGYLEPDTTIDGTWNPALNSVYHQMSGDDFTRAKQGNVQGPGSSIGQVMETMDKWLSPTGLLEAATELGLFWDVEEIEKGWEENPLKSIFRGIKEFTGGNPVKGIQEAWKALGPVDDVLMPAINIMLLSSGVGQVALFARAAKGGLTGARALQAVHGARYAPLSKIRPGLGRGLMETADVTADVNRMRQGGILSSRIAPGAEKTAHLASMGKTVGPTRQAIGQSMTAWREMPNVMIAKKGVQKGMQLGFVSRTEQALGINPDPSLSDLPGVRTATQNLRGYGDQTKFSLPGAIMFEAMFTPTLIIQPGVVKNPFGYISKFSDVGKDAFYTEEFSSAVTNSILTHADEAVEAGLKGPYEVQLDRARRAKEWQEEVRRDGATAALARRFMGDDTPEAVERLGGWMTWMAVSSSIDADAGSKLARLVNVDNVDEFVDGPARFHQTFHTARNTLVSQVRYVDPHDLPGALRTLAQAQAKTVAEGNELYALWSSRILDNPTQGGIRRLEQMIDAHNVTRKKVIKRLLEDHMTPGMLEIAITNHLHDMGDWDGFTKMSGLIDDAASAGQLNGAKSLQGINPETGRQVGRKSHIIKQERAPIGAFTEVDSPFYFDITDVLESDEFLKIQQDGTFNIFGGTFDKGGKFTLARKGTISHKDKLAERKAIEYLEATEETLGRIQNNPTAAKQWRSMLVRVQDEFGISTANFGNIPMPALRKIMNELEMTADTQRRVNRLRSYADKHKIDIEAVTSHVARRLNELDGSKRWSEVHGINTDLGTSTPGRGLQAKKKSLKRQEAYTAVEVDPESIPAELAAQLDEAGYKLVHGVEYMAPRDLHDELIEVKDIVEKGKYQDSLGFIGTKFGHQLEQAEARAKRGVRAFGRTFQRYTQDQQTLMYTAQRRNSLHKALYSVDEGHDFSSVDSADLDQLYDRLQKIAGEISETNAVRLDLAKGEDIFSKGLANIKSSFDPANPVDLVRTRRMTDYMTEQLRKPVREGGPPLYSEAEMVAIIDGLKSSRNIGRKLRGSVTSMEDRLRSNPNLTNGMRAMAMTRIVNKPQMGAGLAGKARGYAAEGAQFASRGMIGGIAGAALITANNMSGQDKVDLNPFDGDGADWGNLARLAGFAMAGRAVSGSKPVYRAQKAMLKKMGAETVASGNKGLMAGTAHRLDNNLYDASRSKWKGGKSGWKHYTYLADSLAVTRDFMRFSLSPIFDASRYAEAFVLSQIGEIPEAVQKAGGLRFNITPTRWRRDRARQIAGSKKPSEAAIQQAAEEWTQVQDEFASIGMARNDFDFEALEAGTARFRQIGILGFNTQAYMASLYADLTRIHKMDPMKAYETAKGAFTYGLRPRSAAEMNVNAVFFPFSFTKKVFGHAARYMAHDWSRAAMIHDAVKTYEVLDEHYDLHDLWRDRFPALDKLQRLNVFAYGATPGEFGGANRPIINFFNASGIDEVTINPILNLFLPQGVEIKNTAAMEDYDRTVRRLAPVFNDMEHLMEDVSEQIYAKGGFGLTRAAEAERGYAMVESINTYIDAQIRANSGIKRGTDPDDKIPAATIADIRQNRWSYFYDLQQNEKKKAREQYPGYQHAVASSIGNSLIKKQDEKDLIAAYKATGVFMPADDAPREIKLGWLISQSSDILKHFGSYDEVPPADRDGFREKASEWAKDEHYLRLGWQKHMLRTWGPIETVLD